MKIPLLVERPTDRYLKLLFENLQRDQRFEEIICASRKTLGINIELENTEDLDIKTKEARPLRSESKSIPKSSANIYIESHNEINLEKEIEIIINEYRILQDWREGLRRFICGDRFYIPKDVPIKLKVRNKKYPYLGTYTDMFSEEGVKIILTKKISRTELKDWIDKNFETIELFLKELSNYSKKDSRRSNFERDRLVVYLRDNWNYQFSQIANIIDDGSTAQTLEKAYSDFPYKSTP